MKGQDFLFIGLGAAALYMVARSGKNISDIFGGGATAAKGLGEGISSISSDVSGLVHEVASIPTNIASSVNKTLRTPPSLPVTKIMFPNASTDTAPAGFTPGVPVFDVFNLAPKSSGGSSKTIRNSGAVERVPADYYKKGNFSMQTSNTGVSIRNDGRTTSGALRAPIFMRD